MLSFTCKLAIGQCSNVSQPSNFHDWQNMNSINFWKINHPSFLGLISLRRSVSIFSHREERISGLNLPLNFLAPNCLILSLFDQSPAKSKCDCSFCRITLISPSGRLVHEFSVSIHLFEYSYLLFGFYCV